MARWCREQGRKATRVIWGQPRRSARAVIPESELSLSRCAAQEILHPVYRFAAGAGAGHWNRDSGLVTSRAKYGDKSGDKGKTGGEGLALRYP
jgi:hypothetical protein